MDNDINNLNTYIELIKYTMNKVKNNETDHITKSVIKSVNKNIDDIKKIYSNKNQNKEDSDNESTKNNDTESISSNDIDFIDPEHDIDPENDLEDEEPTMIYHKIYPNQINKLEKFANSIYLY